MTSRGWQKVAAPIPERAPRTIRVERGTTALDCVVEGRMLTLMGAVGERDIIGCLWTRVVLREMFVLMDSSLENYDASKSLLRTLHP